MQEPIEITDDPPVWAAAAPADIYAAVSAVMGRVGYVQKQKGTDLKYSFAGERDLIAALRPFMVEYGISVSVVQYFDIVRAPGRTMYDKPINITTLTATIRFAHAPSGTFIDVAALGEAQDSGDKSGNKAMTCAFKYALRQTFCIETGDDPDQTQDVQYQQPTTQTKAPPKAKTPATQLAKLLSDARMATTVEQCRSFYTAAQKMDATAVELGEIQTLAKELAAVKQVDKPFAQSELGGK